MRNEALEHPASAGLTQGLECIPYKDEVGGSNPSPGTTRKLPSPYSPLCIDLFCGLGGWSEGFLANGYRCIGYDIEAHDYGTGGYPGELILRDVRSIHGSEFRNATCIVASPPCQAYSYRAMPWSRAKALPPPDNTLFNECFRIQREAIEAAGHHIPLVVENVRGAEKWVGPARWHFGSFYLWGDVPALMPPTLQRGMKGAGAIAHGHLSGNFHYHEKTIKVPGFGFDGVKQPGIGGTRKNGKGDAWFQDGAARHGSKSTSRKAASAQIAKIPFPLADWIAKCFLATVQVPNFPASAISPGA